MPQRFPICRGLIAAARTSVTLLLWIVAGAAHAAALSAQTRASLALGRTVQVIVEIDSSQTDAAANAERARRHLWRDDGAIKTFRAQGYAATESAITAAVRGADAAPVRAYRFLPLSIWQLSSLAALQRLQAHPAVRAVLEDAALHADLVSDLSFIEQPQAAAEGALGAGTTIAVIDGGLGGNYTLYSDFGTCTAVATPPSTCRLVYNQDFYPGLSQETVHGTNVSAIALGVAPSANLAMFDVFNGTTAKTSDILTALDTVLSDQATYNIVVVNLSLGDGSSNATTCGSTSPFTSAIGNLASAGITSVVAAGNNGSKTGLADPACVPGAVSVGAVYSAATGAWQWPAAADSGGTCTDTSAPDLVTCFSQSASYLTVLGPGTFVNAPNASFQLSGTSQATPHISGSVAVLRARYAAEPLSQTVQRLTNTGVADTDPGNALTRSRVDLVGAVNEGTAVSLSGTGPTTATAGGNGSYVITITNNGPLIATDLQLSDNLPLGAAVASVSSGCSFAGAVVTCKAGSLAANAAISYTINVNWSVSGSVYDSASLTLDQTDTATSGEQLAFGTPPSESSSGDGPLPAWSYVLLAAALMAVGMRAGRVPMRERC
jgi:uncharacterized repeat protein (TIGR01451 family)